MLRGNVRRKTDLPWPLCLAAGPSSTACPRYTLWDQPYPERPTIKYHTMKTRHVARENVETRPTCFPDQGCQPEALGDPRIAKTSVPLCAQSRPKTSRSTPQDKSTERRASSSRNAFVAKFFKQRSKQQAESGTRHDVNGHQRARAPINKVHSFAKAVPILCASDRTSQTRAQG